jgi:hypothetical protein
MLGFKAAAKQGQANIINTLTQPPLNHNHILRAVVKISRPLILVIRTKIDFSQRRGRKGMRTAEY